MRNNVLVIGIGGLPYSGKANLARCLAEHFATAQTSVLSVDLFSRKSSNGVTSKNGLHFLAPPSETDWSSVRRELMLLIGRQFIEHPRKANLIRSCLRNIHGHDKRGIAHLVLVVGVYALYSKRIRELFDIKIFVSVPLKSALNCRPLENPQRHESRELHCEPNYSDSISTTLSIYQRYLVPTERLADLVVRGDRPLERVANSVMDYIRYHNLPASLHKVRALTQVPSAKCATQAKELRKRSEPLFPQGKRFRNRVRFWERRYTCLIAVQSTKFLRRLIDILVSASLLVCLSPLLLIVAWLIRWIDGAPVIIWQKRVGRWGRGFEFPKFRTMVLNADTLKKDLLPHNDRTTGVSFKMKNDPRVTPLGRILRRTSIDELPQLWTVLKGDMCLVGPRPPLPDEVAHYTLRERRKLDVKPGLTCFWQISGRSEIPFSEQVELDVQYIEKQSLWLDVKIIMKTIFAVLSGRGAY